MISELEELGWPLDNIKGTAWTSRVMPFDSVMCPEAQNAWIQLGGEPARCRDATRFDEQRKKYERLFARWCRLPRAEESLSILSEYDPARFIPEPWATEGTEWNISCRLPTGERGALWRININHQEVFSVLDGARLSVYLMMPVYSVRKALEDLQADLSGIRIDESRWWQAGGPDQGAVYVDDARQLGAFLSDALIARAIRRFNLGLVRKGASFWARSHCPQLIDGICH